LGFKNIEHKTQYFIRIDKACLFIICQQENTLRKYREKLTMSIKNIFLHLMALFCEVKHSVLMYSGSLTRNSI